MNSPIDMSSRVKMSPRQKLFIIISIIVMLGVLGLLYISTLQVKQKSDKGENYVTTIAPASPASKGQKGDKGDSPTQQEIGQAVADYCAQTNICTGKAPSQEIVFAAVFQYCSDNRCKGEKGSDALPVTTDQIYSQVVAYCANNQCKGADGSNGINGKDGTDGRTIELRGNSEANAIEWKYTDETEWKTLAKYCELTESCNTL